MKSKNFYFFLCIVIFTMFHITSSAKADSNTQRMDLYKKYATYLRIPWYIIGAIDQYERNTKNYKEYCPKEDEIISICISPQMWSGYMNPNKEDNRPYTISIFNGMGVDGDLDGYANRLNSIDRLMTLLFYIREYGTSYENIEKALYNYYQTEKGVKIIFEIAELFQRFNTIELSERVFPIPKYYQASIVNNFGTGRSYGGYRSHEGVDIFAHYGTPVVSTAYGIVEIIGWNRYGGYRIGIRDVYNTYEYYAHLNNFKKGLKEGDIVRPGQVIGYVGATGYGKEGTSGRFPPHLHFGFYKFDGRIEWSFNPYRYLRKWPRINVS